MALTFHEQLWACRARGELTTADLAHWLERPFATVRAWLENGHEPRAPYARLTRQRLVLLLQAIDTKTGFPIPAMSEQKRPLYIRQIRSELESAGVPATRAS